MSIVGATATGKTALAFALASGLGGCELVSVDAMAVYRGLDVGTAKPVRGPGDPPLHLVDVVQPSEDFSVARFQALCESAVRAIRARGNLVVYVGGTGLYHRAALDSLAIPPRFPAVARDLEREAAEPGGLGRLHRRLQELDAVAASRMEASNRRRVVRALEVTLGSGRPFSSFGPGLADYREQPVVILGLYMPREELDERLRERLAEQMRSGFLDEVRGLRDAGRPLSRTAAQAIGYRELLDHLAGELTLDEAVEKTLRRLRSFARRQEAWFRRDPRVTWLDARSPTLVPDALGLWRAATTPVPCETATR